MKILFFQKHFFSLLKTLLLFIVLSLHNLFLTETNAQNTSYILQGNKANIDHGGRIQVYVQSGEERNKPIDGVRVQFFAVGESGSFFTCTTNQQGYCITPFLRPNMTYSIKASKEGYLDSELPNIQLKKHIKVERINLLKYSKGDLRITLSWCSQKSGAVADVDSYLTIPPLPNESPAHPLHYNYKGDNKDYHGTNLDVDVVNWNGPETVTILTLRKGTYIFYVNNYDVRSDKQALGNSEITIQVFRKGRQIKTYRVPPGTGINYEVFHIVDGRIVDIQRYNDTLWCSGCR